MEEGYSRQWELLVDGCTQAAMALQTDEEVTMEMLKRGLSQKEGRVRTQTSFWLFHERHIRNSLFQAQPSLPEAWKTGLQSAEQMKREDGDEKNA